RPQRAPCSAPPRGGAAPVLPQIDIGPRLSSCTVDMAGADAIPETRASRGPAPRRPRPRRRAGVGLVRPQIDIGPRLSSCTVDVAGADAIPETRAERGPGPPRPGGRRRRRRVPRVSYMTRPVTPSLSPAAASPPPPYTTYSDSYHPTQRRN